MKLKSFGYQSIMYEIEGFFPTGIKALFIFFVIVPSLLPRPAEGIITCVNLLTIFKINVSYTNIRVNYN